MFHKTLTALAATLYLAGPAFAEDGGHDGTSDGFTVEAAAPTTLYKRGEVAAVDGTVVDLDAALAALLAEFCADAEESDECTPPKEVTQMISDARVTRIKSITDAMMRQAAAEAMVATTNAETLAADALGLLYAARTAANIPATVQAERLQEKIGELETLIDELRSDLTNETVAGEALEATLAEKEGELAALRAQVEELTATKDAAEVLRRAAEQQAASLDTIAAQRDDALVALKEAARFAHELCNNGEAEGADFACGTLFRADADDALIHFLQWAEDQKAD